MNKGSCVPILLQKSSKLVGNYPVDEEGGFPKRFGGRDNLETGDIIFVGKGYYQVKSVNAVTIVVTRSEYTYCVGAGRGPDCEDDNTETQGSNAEDEFRDWLASLFTDLI